MTSTAEKKITAYDLARAIRERYEPPEWLLEPEMTLDGRRLDMVAFNLWGARGYRIVGFEIKVSRGDWMRELAQLQKSERWMEVVDKFYVVTPPKLIQLDELPRGWGLLELTGARMMTRAHAEEREVKRVLPRELAARLLTRMREQVTSSNRATDDAIRNQIRAEVEKDLELSHARQSERTNARLAELEREHKELRDAAGLSGDWRAHQKLLAGLALLADLQAKNVNGDDAWVTRQLERMIQDNETRISHIRDALQQIKQEHATCLAV